jgi:hypothetical protein
LIKTGDVRQVKRNYSSQNFTDVSFANGDVKEPAGEM